MMYSPNSLVAAPYEVLSRKTFTPAKALPVFESITFPETLPEFAKAREREINNIYTALIFIKII